ncbi:toll-like receptor 5 [Scleropages formosus]|uniref:Toll like receptor 5 n=1 Tax=Scleropages formosus TaxID=113540 RepID=A0A8C9RAD3_SCLFO|nr:toll-like receptor 5 [Scleropages formosus]
MRLCTSDLYVQRTKETGNSARRVARSSARVGGAGSPRTLAPIMREVRVVEESRRNTVKIYIVLFLGSCLLGEKAALACRINERRAMCTWNSLKEVPVLPSDIILLDLSINNIGEVNEASFVGLEQLQILDLGSQRTEKLTIKEGTFRRLSNLTYLHLGDNHLLILEQDAFVGLSRLQNLVLLNNGLDRLILEEEYLKPLVSLETLDLSFNKIETIRPGLFFQNMTKLKVVRLKLNKVGSMCEQDLLGFQGKDFNFLEFSSLQLNDMEMHNFNWQKCGNPFRNISVRVLDLSGNGLYDDKARLFFKAIEGTNISHLILSSNTMGKGFGFSNLKDPTREIFSGLKNSSVKTLDLSRNYIFSLEFSVLSALQDAEEIILSDNKINQIQRNAFFGLVSLQKLSLSYNLIGEIYEYTFYNLPNLVELDLSYNHIGVVAYKSFSKMSKLRVLNIFGNSLKQLHTFETIPNLVLLNMSDNKLTSVYGLSVSSRNSSIIDLSHNRLSDLKCVYEILNKMPSVQILALSHNLLVQCIPEYSVPPQNSLIYLDLEHNALQTVWQKGICFDIFDNLSKLLYLFLSHNFLSSLPDGIFKGLTSLQVLDVSYNSLTYLPRNIFPESLEQLNLSHNFLSSPDPHNFQFIRVLDLGMNRFLCNCALKDFLLWMNQTNVIFFTPIDSLTCEYPKSLRGVQIKFYADLCEEEDERLISKLRLTLSIGCSILVMWFLICTITFAHFRGECFIFYKRTMKKVIEGHEKKPSLDTGCKYDAFLCFCSSDSKWVEMALLKRLDSQFSDKNLLRCCFEARDFIPGVDYISSISDAIWSSRKTICIVTEAFLKDGWCLETFRLAQSRMFDEVKDVLIAVVVGSIPHFRLMKHEAIRAFVKKKEYLRWPEDLQDLEWFYAKLTGKILEKKFKNKNATELQNIRTVVTN